MRSKHLGPLSPSMRNQLLLLAGFGAVSKKTALGAHESSAVLHSAMKALIRRDLVKERPHFAGPPHGWVKAYWLNKRGRRAVAPMRWDIRL